jgi:hypothetical protein
MTTASEVYAVRGGEGVMKTDNKGWLDEYAVTCRVFKGRWSIRHCLRMYNDIKDLKIHMSSRANGRVTRHESQYNPCERCKILTQYIDSLPREENEYKAEETYQVWAS